MKLNTMCLFFVFICFFTLSACSPSYTLILYNNSGGTVKIQLGDNGIIYIIEDEHEATLGYFDWVPIIVQAETTNWVYNITNSPPRKYGAPRGWGLRNKIYFQLETTGEIYTMLPTEEFPLKDVTNQPPGFPLRPITEKD